MEDTSLHNLHAPWIKLNALKKESEELNDAYDEYFEAADEVDNFSNLTDLEVS